MEEILYQIGEAVLLEVDGVESVTYPNKGAEATIEMASGDKYKLTITKEK